MSMSTHVIGFKPPDEHFDKMLAAFDACKAAGVEPPTEVYDFFDGRIEPERTGVEVEIPTRRYNSLGKEGYEIDVDSIPEGVKVIRFFNSY